MKKPVKQILSAIFLIMACSIHAATRPRGDDRLRELVVFPEMSLNFQINLSFERNRWVIDEQADHTEMISQLHKQLTQHPEDVDTLLSLGDQLAQNGETNESASCFRDAEKICRIKVSANPQDASSLMRLGEALFEQNKSDEAESIYRKATLVSPNDWKTWAALGNSLASGVLALGFPQNEHHQPSLAGLGNLQNTPNEVPTASAFLKAEAGVTEASKCFHRAMTLAPREPELFIQLAGYASISNMLNSISQHFRDSENVGTTPLGGAFYYEESIADLQRAADLSPTNCSYTCIAIYFGLLSAASHAQITNSMPSLNILPDGTRQWTQSAITRLEDISMDPDPRKSISALEDLGKIYLVLENGHEAASDFRQALSLDPSNDQGWELLLAALLECPSSPQDLATVCESRLKYRDSGRNRLLLAKCLAKQLEWDKAISQAEIAARLDTNDIVSPLLIGAIALKQSDQKKFMPIANYNFWRATSIWKSIPDGETKAKRWREIALNEAIFSALDNRPLVAKDWANLVLKTFPNDEQAKNILAAIN